MEDTVIKMMMMIAKFIPIKEQVQMLTKLMEQDKRDGIDISEKTAVCMQILTIAVMHKNDTVEQTLKHTDKMLHKLNLSSILDQES